METDDRDLKGALKRLETDGFRATARALREIMGLIEQARPVSLRSRSETEEHLKVE